MLAAVMQIIGAESVDQCVFPFFPFVAGFIKLTEMIWNNQGLFVRHAPSG